MKEALYAFQQALYARLSGTVECSVFDHVPAGAAYPYITLGEDTATDWSTKSSHGQEVTHTLHVWSRYRGMAETKRLLDSVVQAVTGVPLIVAGFYVALLQVDIVEAFREPDGITRHGVIRLRAKLQEAS